MAYISCDALLTLNSNAGLVTPILNGIQHNFAFKLQLETPIWNEIKHIRYRACIFLLHC
jgi:hypothetical protein